MQSKKVYFIVSGGHVISMDPLRALDYLIDTLKVWKDTNAPAFNIDISDYGQWTKYKPPNGRVPNYGSYGKWIFDNEHLHNIDNIRDYIIEGLGSGDLYCSDKNSNYSPPFFVN